jgi:hypothetical protein
MVADELRRQADNFVELQDLQPAITRVMPAREGQREDRQGNGNTASSAMGLYEDA